MAYVQQSPTYDPTTRAVNTATGVQSLAEALFGNPAKASDLAYKNSESKLNDLKSQRQQMQNTAVSQGLADALNSGDTNKIIAQFATGDVNPAYATMSNPISKRDAGYDLSKALAVEGVKPHSSDEEMAGVFETLSPEEQKQITMSHLAPKMNGGGGGLSFDSETGELTYEPVNEPQGRSPGFANALGVPSVPLNNKNMSPKDASAYNKQTRIDAQKILNGDDVAQALAKANSNKLDAQRFSDLMSKQDTGGYLALPLVPTVQGWFDPEVREMTSIQDRLTPLQRAAGSGSTSNFDAGMFKNALPGVDKPKATNENIIAGMEARANDEQQYQAFRSDFLQANGHLNGADKAWQAYLDANPIFDPKSATPENLVLNPSRQDYKTFFSSSAPIAPETTPAADGLSADPAIFNGVQPKNPPNLPVPTPAPAAQSTVKKTGGVLHMDAKGNKAMVYPDGSYEEVH